MTEKEYREIWAEIKARKERTSFPDYSGEAAREVYQAHAGHAEYGESQH